MHGRVVLVTGGAGFIGRHLCDKLIAEGARVICMDSFVTGRLGNIAHLMGREGFRFVLHDVTEPLDLDEEVDDIFNLACPASPVKYRQDPIHTFGTCVKGAMNLLDFAVECDARILQASTSEVYGDPDESPQSESYHGNVNTCGPRACYDEGKRGAETLFYHYRECLGLDTRIARIFNTYGPGMAEDDGRVVSNFVVQALSGKPLTIYGTGEQTRSFCYVDDLVDGLIALMTAPGAPRGPVNLGNPGEFTMLDLAEMVLEKTGSSSQLSFHDLPHDDPRKRCPDISLAKRTLNWSPRISLSEGLDRTIAYFAADLHKDVIAE